MLIAPDLITVTATYEQELAAERAELLVTVQGSSLVTGRAALRKAREVARIVEDLEKLGIGEDRLSLEGVHAQVASGILGKSSSASYRLRVRCDQLDLLPDVLGAITGAKTARLEQVEWGYPDSAELHASWLEQSIARANIKARAAAQALGTRIVGVHRMTEMLIDPGSMAYMDPSGAEYDGAMKRRSARVELGFELGNSKRTGMSVTVEYRVEGYGGGGAGR